MVYLGLNENCLQGNYSNYHQITAEMKRKKLKPVIKVLDEHVALSTSFSSITPPVVLIKSCLHDQNQIGVTWDTICLLGTQYAYRITAKG